MKEKVTAGKIWGIIYPPLIYVLATNIIATIVTFVVTILITASNPSAAQATIIEQVNSAVMSQLMMIQLCSGIVTAPILIFFINRDRQREKLNGRFVKYEMVFPLKYVLIIPFAFCVMFAGNSFASILQTIFPSLVDSAYLKAQNFIWGTGVVVQVLEAGIIGPVVEELIYRGLLYPRIKKVTKVIPAAIITSLLFAVFHGNALQGIYAFLFGMGCVYVYEKYKSLAAPILFHISGNMISIIIQNTINTAEAETQMPIPVVAQVVYLLVVGVIAGLLAFGIATMMEVLVKPKEKKY